MGKYIKLFIAPFVILNLALLQGCGKSSEESAQSVKLVVETVPVRKGDLPVILDVVGTTYANQTVKVKSRIDSKIEELKFQDGDFVKQGQVLFILDKRQLTAQLQQTQALLKQQEAQLHMADLDLKRGEKLLPQKVITQQQFDNLKTNYDSAVANHEATLAQLQNVETLKSYTTITAPISGRVGTINQTVGNTVKALDADANALVTINQISPLKIQLPIAQQHYEKLRELMAAGTVVVEIRDKQGKLIDSGHMDYSENQIDANTRNINVWAEVPNEKESLWPGMFVDAYIHMGAYTEVLMIPVESIHNTQDEKNVYLLQQGKVHIEKVEVIYTNNEMAVVEGKLKAGDLVIVGGFLKLKEGLEVTAQSSKENKT